MRPQSASVCSGELLERINDPHDPVYVKYLTYRNTLNKIKRKGKEEYYYNLIEKHHTQNMCSDRTVLYIYILGYYNWGLCIVLRGHRQWSEVA